MIDVNGIEIKLDDWLAVSSVKGSGWAKAEFISLAKVTQAHPGGIQILRYKVENGNLIPFPRKQRKSKSECVMVLNKELFERMQ